MFKPETKKIALASLCLIVGFLAIDFGFGTCMDYARKIAKGGDTQNNYYILNELSDSIIIMGSSRANHHYMSDNIAKRLKMSTYNCGIDGNGIILAYAFLNNMVSRGESPSMVIYDFFPKFDLHNSGDLSSSLTHLRPGFNNPVIREVIVDVDHKEAVKNYLYTYRYNTVFIQYLIDATSPRFENQHGYKPRYGSITIDFKPEASKEMPLDPLKIKYFEKFLKLCDDNGIKLVFVSSPSFHKTELMHNVSKFMQMHGISPHGTRYRYINFSNNPCFIGHKDLFSDPAHLNDSGAAIFTNALIDSLTRVIRN